MEQEGAKLWESVCLCLKHIPEGQRNCAALMEGIRGACTQTQMLTALHLLSLHLIPSHLPMIHNLAKVAPLSLSTHAYSLEFPDIII